MPSIWPNSYQMCGASLRTFKPNAPHLVERRLRSTLHKVCRGLWEIHNAAQQDTQQDQDKKKAPGENRGLWEEALAKAVRAL